MYVVSSCSALLGAVLTVAQAAAQPLDVTPVVDSSRATSQAILSAIGGTLTATSSDGTVFTLRIPPNALLSNETITMTPVASIGDLPTSSGLVAGVHLEPNGLRLLRPATLTIQPSRAIPVDQQVGFGYFRTGRDFHFYPLALGQAIVLQLYHFSGWGLGQGTPTQSPTPLDSEARLQNDASRLISQERTCEILGSGCDPDFLRNLQALFQAYFDQVMVPLLQQALTDDNVVELAITKAISFERMIQLAGLEGTEPFATDLEYIQQAIGNVLVNYFNRASDRCMGTSDLGARFEQAAKMLRAIKTYRAIVGDPGSRIPDWQQRIIDCGFPPLNLDLDSSVIAQDPIEIENAHVQTQGVRLTFDFDRTMYRAVGAQLNYPSFFIPLHGPPGLFAVNSSLGNDGRFCRSKTLTACLTYDSPHEEYFVRLVVVPNVTETLIAGLQLRDMCYQSPPSVVNAYVGIQAACHSRDGDILEPYAMRLNSTESFTFGRTVMGASYSENATLSLNVARQ